MAIFEKTKTVVATRRYLKAVGAPRMFVVNGQFVAAASIVEVSMYEAADLIARGCAVDATEAEVTAAGANIIVAPSHHDKWTDAQ
jgi:hypothetical protein